MSSACPDNNLLMAKALTNIDGSLSLMSSRIEYLCVTLRIKFEGSNAVLEDWQRYITAKIPVKRMEHEAPLRNGTADVSGKEEDNRR